VGGSFEVFEAAASTGIGKVIFTPTTSVYRPDTRYGSSKIFAELIAEDYRKHRLMNVLTLPARVYSVLGPSSVRQIQRLGALVLEGRVAYR
jgi:nucleoside-diphosphate-sugar epimerase